MNNSLAQSDDDTCDIYHKNLTNVEINDFEELENKLMNLILNNQIIQFRETDNYINATQLCKAGGKNFGHWYSLEGTIELLSVLSSNIGIPILELIDKKVGGTHTGSKNHGFLLLL